MLGLVVLLFLPGVSSAQELSHEDGVADCFDYYTFNSVQVDVSPTVVSTVPGVPLIFSGTLKNDNPYPIVDGSVFVKIFRKTTTGETHRNGYPVVDQFFVKEGITLPASSSSPFSFEWKVPRHLPSGDYEADMFFLVGKKYNLLGLSFTDDVTGNKSVFSIKSDAPDVPVFDKDAVTLNGESYAFAAFPPHFEKDNQINADVVLVNPSSEPRTVEVVWILFNWSGEREENRLDQKSEVVTLAPNERKSLRYVADPAKSTGAVTFLRAEASYQDTTSILNIRFVRDGIDEVRINFPGISKYPLKQGESNTLFSCLHSTNSGLVKNGELVLTLTDSFGIVLDTYTYSGDISGAMMGVKNDFTPDVSSSTFMLKAELRKDGKTVETYETTYRCEDIDRSLCPLNTNSTGSLSGKENVDGGTSPFGMGVALLFVILLLIPLSLIVWFFFHRKKGKQPGPTLTVLIVLGAAIFIAPDPVEAKGVTWSTSVNGWLAAYWDWDAVDSGKKGGWGEGLQNPTISISYVASVKDAVTGASIVDGATVPVGTKMKFVPKKYEDTDISWFGTGYSGDSPYGHWKASAAVPNANITCDSADFVTKYKNTSGSNTNWYWDVYIPFSVNPPTPTYVFSGSAGLSCSGDSCTVTSPGTILASILFPSTQGKYYYRYYDYRSDSSVSYRSAGCYGNNVAMRFATSCNPSSIGYSGTSTCSGQASSDYILSVPQQTVTYNFNVANASNPPVAPTVIGNGGMVDSSLPFTATSTDPDEDTLRYGFDWDKDGSVDQWMPANGYVASGTPQTASYSWITEGNKAFQVLAEDVNGVRSSWTQHAALIAVPSKFLTLCISGSKISPYSVSVGDTRDLTAHYGLVGDCSDGIVAGASFADSSVAAVRLEGATLHADSVGSETVTVSYMVGGSVLTDDALVNVTEPAGSDEPTEPVSPSDTGNSLNWREVQPGF